MGLFDRLLGGRRPSIELAANLLADQHYDQALAEAEKVAKRAPRDPMAQRLMGECLCALDRHAEAILPFETAIAVGGEGTRDIFLWLQLCYLRAGRLDDARTLLTDFLDQADDHTDADLIQRAQAGLKKIDSLQAISQKQLNRLDAQRRMDLLVSPTEIRMHARKKTSPDA